MEGFQVVAVESPVPHANSGKPPPQLDNFRPNRPGIGDKRPKSPAKEVPAQGKG